MTTSTSDQPPRKRWINPRFFWPTVEDQASARAAAGYAGGLAIWLAVSNLGVGVLSYFGTDLYSGQGASGPDAGLFNMIGGIFVGVFLGIVSYAAFKASRIAAVIVSLFILLEWYARAGMGADRISSSLYFLVFFTIVSVGGLRGAFAYHRYKRQARLAITTQ
jgi:hypothetical protein